MVAIRIYVRAECTAIWEHHYKTVLAVAPEDSGRYLLDLRTNAMEIHTDDSLPPHHARIAVVTIHDHDKGCNKADATILHRYPAGASECLHPCPALWLLECVLHPPFRLV
jgi:hypothetical protein